MAQGAVCHCSVGPPREQEQSRLSTLPPPVGTPPVIRDAVSRRPPARRGPWVGHPQRQWTKSVWATRMKGASATYPRGKQAVSGPLAGLLPTSHNPQATLFFDTCLPPPWPWSPMPMGIVSPMPYNSGLLLSSFDSGCQVFCFGNEKRNYDRIT